MPKMIMVVALLLTLCTIAHSGADTGTHYTTSVETRCIDGYKFVIVEKTPKAGYGSVSVAITQVFERVGMLRDGNPPQPAMCK